MSKKITVLGAGAFGSALGQVLNENGHEVKFYDPTLDVSLEESLAEAEIMVLAIPSSALGEMLPKLPKGKPLIVATKGILGDKILADFLDYMVISGPGFAQDIMNHKKTLLTATDQRVIDLFSRDYLTFDQTADRRGVLMCGALKNVYAILAGRMNLEPYTPTHEAFLGEVEVEMQDLLLENGADPATVSLACGQGDLRLTCAEPSRNYEFGQILRQNPVAKPEKTVEGVTALGRIKNGAIKVPETAVKLRGLLELCQKWN